MYVLLPRFRCATLDRSDQTISHTLPSYQIIVRPKAFWSDHSATQKTSDQTIVRPKILCNFIATNAPSDQTNSEYIL